jgi:hypothetical protein
VESTVAVATIVAKNYLSFARVLGESFRRHHPGVPFYALLTDEVDGYFDPAAEPFSIVGLSDLRIPDLHRFRFHYARKEVAVAVKPYLLSHPVPFTAQAPVGGHHLLRPGCPVLAARPLRSGLWSTIQARERPSTLGALLTHSPKCQEASHASATRVAQARGLGCCDR